MFIRRPESCDIGITRCPGFHQIDTSPCEALLVERRYVHLHPDYKEKASNTITQNMKAAGIAPQFHPRLKGRDKGETAKSLKAMVGVTGIEPVTPSMSTKCSPAELHAHCRCGGRPYIGLRLI